MTNQVCQYCDEAIATKKLIYSTTGATAWYCDKCAKDTGVDEFDKEILSQSSPKIKGQRRVTAKAIKNKTICAKSAMGIKNPECGCSGCSPEVKE